MVILHHARGVGVGTLQKMNSSNQAPGASPRPGESGGDRGAPGQTYRRVLPHHRKTDLCADPARLRAVGPNSPPFHEGGSAKGRWRTYRKSQSPREPSSPEWAETPKAAR